MEQSIRYLGFQGTNSRQPTDLWFWCCVLQYLQGVLLGGDCSTGRDMGEWSVVLLLPWDHWLHWSMRVEEAEVRNRAQRAVCTTGTALQEMTSVNQLNFIPEDRECIGKPGDKP